MKPAAVNEFRLRSAWVAVATLLALAGSDTARACATCFGASDDQMAAGMNMGILVLLAVVVTVLGGILTAAIVLAQRARRMEALDLLDPATGEPAVSLSSASDPRA